MSNIVPLRQLCIPAMSGQYGIPASAEDFSDLKTRYLRITDISDEGVLLNNDKKSVSSSNLEKYLLGEGDIVFARTGNSTGRTYYYDQRDGKLAFAGFLIKYALDSSKVNPKYLKFYTLSTLYKKWVSNLSVASTRGNINAQTFGDCPILLPKKLQQDYLVRILSLITDKIRINNSVSERLEAIVKLLFRFWFLDFNFPDNGKPYRESGGEFVWNHSLNREIPKGWQSKHIKELVKVSTEQVNPQKNRSQDYKYYSIPTFDEIGTYSVTKGSEIMSNKFVVEKNDILVSKLNPRFNRIIYSKEENLQVCSTEFVVWRTESQVLKNYLYTIARDSGFVTYCINSSSGTSHSHNRVNPEVMMDYIIPYNENIAREFGRTIDPFLQQIFVNQSENIELKLLHDWLLPMLIGGHLTPQ